MTVDMVSELMREMNLRSVRIDSKTLYRKERKNEKRKMDNMINQKFSVDAPNQVWVGDVTYFRYNNKSYYVCVVLDLFARMVIGYKISFKNSTQLVKATFKRAYESRKPQGRLIFHSDRGGNYVSKTYDKYLKSLNVDHSYSRAHVPYDNAVVESFFSSLKREELYRTKFHSEKEFLKSIEDYIVFYNTKRPHSFVKNKTPQQAEKEFFSKHSVY